ncbi:MAG: hypothetical protein AB7U35_10085 [Sphingobium sp.]
MKSGQALGGFSGGARVVETSGALPSGNSAALAREPVAGDSLPFDTAVLGQ